MFSTIDKALAAVLGALLPLLFAQIGPAPEFLTGEAAQVILAGIMAWLVPNKDQG